MARPTQCVPPIPYLTQGKLTSGYRGAKLRCHFLGKEPQAVGRRLPRHGAEPEMQDQAAHAALLHSSELFTHGSRGAIDQAVFDGVSGGRRAGADRPLLVSGVETAT